MLTFLNLSPHLLVQKPSSINGGRGKYRFIDWLPRMFLARYNGFMLNPKVEVTSGANWDPRSHAFFIVSVRSKQEAEKEVKVSIDASFTPYPVPVGLIVRAELYIACTGARFQLSASSGKLIPLTQDVPLHTENSIEDATSSVVEVSPSLKAQTTGLTLEGSFGSTKKEREKKSTVKFSSNETRLTTTRIGENTVRWSFNDHRGEKVVRDFPEGNLELEAKAKWTEDSAPTIESVTKPTDRRFFGADRRPLGKLWTLGLAAKLAARGVPLPEVGEIKHRIVLTSSKRV